MPAAAASIPPFHLAIPVHDVPAARDFYGTLLGCVEGRRDGDLWQDYNFSGHQLVCHFVSKTFRAQDHYNNVDAKGVPVPHFGLCLTKPAFAKLSNKLLAAGDAIDWVIKPCVRFVGMPGEQSTMFLKDPSNNSLEFKTMKHPQNLFAKYDVADSKTAKTPASKKPTKPTAFKKKTATATTKAAAGKKKPVSKGKK
jgi:extradiol dioxygenase family protein